MPRFVVVFSYSSQCWCYLSDERRQRLAMETLDELEWCLEQLEAVQTHRSVSDMATSKVIFRHQLYTVVLMCLQLLRRLQ